jgi:eukaryotic-like serine/threonine-protein kinase
MAFKTEFPSILRFGTFEADLRAREVRKQGVRIKLQEQPFHVLTLLLQRPGEVVTREELRSQNWPADTFVDFDNSLNTAINKLREALGDSADNPRFVETLPRRGYRFIAPVARVNGTTTVTSANVLGRLRGRKVVVAAAIVVITAGIAGGLLWRTRHRPVLTEKDTIVLGDFANSTGDSVFDGTLREGLSVQLQQSPFLSLVSEEGIRQTLRMMGQPTNVRLTPQIAREVCQRTNSTAALDGSIAVIGTQYNLILRAVNCMNGDSLASAEAQSNDKSHVLDALSKAAAQMRTKLGESLSTVQKYNTPLEQATTPSLEALQAYSLGWRALNEDADVATASSLWRRAIQLDPDFAAAYDSLGSGIEYIGPVLAVEYTRKAFELRTRVSEREKLIIEGDYYTVVTGDLMKARETFTLGEQIYPREVSFRNALGVLYNDLGQNEAGLREDREAFRLGPSTLNYRYLIHTYLLLNRDADAASLASEARGKGPEAALEAILYSLAFYRNDGPEMARQAATFKTRDDDLLLALEADTAAYFGRLGRARELSRQAADSAKRAGENESALTYEGVAALREGLFANADKALQLTELAKERSGGPDKYYAVVLALAYAGDGSQELADRFNASFPENTVVQFNYLPTLRAKLALIHANPEQALVDLEVAAPYELGSPASWFYNWPNLYPVYVRGEAYLAAHKGSEAVAEFQKILDHRGIVLNEPIGALAHLQLGRAYTMHGDGAKARAAYQDFLTLWKDADPDIPIFRQAKAEYAKLQ